MPVQRCEKDGKKGWKWGSEGTCYTGPAAKQKATDQGVAAMYAEAKAAGHEGKGADAYVRERSKTEL